MLNFLRDKWPAVQTLIPTWIVEYRSVRPTLTRRGLGTDIKRIEAAAMTPEDAARAVKSHIQGYCEIISVSVGSPTGMS